MALARCLLRDKPILLLDEPFSALDPDLRQEMLALLERLCTEKKLTLLLVTHQPNELIGRIDRIIHIENGRIEKTAEKPTALFGLTQFNIETEI